MKLKLPRAFAPELETEQVLVSIVTITLNAARDLPLTIESVAGQEFDDFEYVIVDGQSWDSSHEIFRRYAKQIDRVVETEDSGVYWAMNFAAKQCRGKYIIFMNAGDTFYSSKSLSNVFAQCNDEDPDIIHGDHVYVDKALELHTQSIDFGVIRKALQSGDISHKWLSRFPCHQATLTRRELLIEMGGYDTRLEICADHDFFLRAYDAGAKTKYVDETIAHYVGGGISAQRSERCQLEWIKTYRSKSLFPHKIDQLLGADPLVRFDTQSEATGTKLTGFYPLEGPSLETKLDTTYSWCAGDAFSLISPTNLESIGLALSGKNSLESQRLSITNAGEEIGEVDIPLGEFDVRVPFHYPLAPRSILDVFPTRATVMPVDRFVSIILKSFHFEASDFSENEMLSIGRDYAFGEKELDTIAPLLRLGWATPEVRHTWSIGSQSTLMLPIEEDANEISFVLSGNPFVSNPDRHVTILVNGKPIAVDLPLSTVPKNYTFPLAASEWHSGYNFVAFVPRKTASAPADPRELGIGLYTLRID